MCSSNQNSLERRASVLSFEPGFTPPGLGMGLVWDVFSVWGPSVTPFSPSVHAFKKRNVAELLNLRIYGAKADLRIRLSLAAKATVGPCGILPRSC